LAIEAKAGAANASRSADDPLAPFSEPVRRWFEGSFAAPTPAQAQGWKEISAGASTLICAPTGSGKTLAAFLWGIDRLSRDRERPSGVRIVYISPLKALSYDIERNLRAPLRGIGADIAVAIRTGDTSQAERQSMRRTPPDILITTPESLYLMLSSGAREILAPAEAVIVDEIHAVAQSKRGSHLALTLERLEWLARKHRDGEGSLQRIGLSATQRPLERIARFLVGPNRECSIVDAGRSKPLDLQIVVPVEDMTDPGLSPAGGAPLGDRPEEQPHRRGGGTNGATGPAGQAPDRVDPNFDGASNPRSIWPAIYPELLKLVREHTSTIVFVNSRRGAERLAKRLNELAASCPASSLPPRSSSGSTWARSTS
jgi:ATP-dependent helicase Lhr and Lhr-like helicase